MGIYNLEICVDTFESAEEAVIGGKANTNKCIRYVTILRYHCLALLIVLKLFAGAKQLEVCSALDLGGLTPSAGW